MIKKCSKCTEEMECKSDNDCWCLTKPYIRLDETDQYNDCLCEKCLLELYNARSQNSN
jgi:hypothetical protein